MHGAYTVEDQCEGLQRFAVGAANARGWRRRVAVGLAWIIPAGFIVASAVALVGLVISRFI